ncbi:MAG TPA: S49 family peptidase [Kiloniellales bacterium]|nr:S49 family peptidase [Kiloniellales bacterium]
MDLRSLLSRLPVQRFKHPPPVVAVVGLTGVIGSLGPLRGGMTVTGLEPVLERAVKLPRLAALALVVNSPGGSATQSDLIARRIRDIAGEKQIPVYAFCEDVAASGGYWLACAADRIYVRETSIIGSIGVISASFGFNELLQRMGVERRVHTAGEKKAMLDPFRPEDPEDVARLQAIQREMHETFKTWVRECRGGRLKTPEEELFSGEFWTGRRALELGLADEIGELRQVLRARFGESVKLHRVDGRRPWWRRRMGFARAGGLSGFRDPGPGLPEPRDWAAGLLAAVEERAHWARFGL